MLEPSAHARATVVALLFVHLPLANVRHDREEQCGLIKEVDHDVLLSMLSMYNMVISGEPVKQPAIRTDLEQNLFHVS